MLKEQLLIPARRGAVIDDCVVLIDEQVASKSGLSGLAIKGAYAVVKAVKPGIIRESVDHMLDEFVARLEPFYAAALGAGGDITAHFATHQADVANGLLGVTDDKAAHARNATLKKAYEKLRPTAQKHVEAAVPGIARLLTRHASPAAA